MPTLCRPDARKVASDNSLIDFALMAASNHDNPDVLSKSRQICTAMATTDDAKRHSERFAASLANRDSESAASFPFRRPELLQHGTGRLRGLGPHSGMRGGVSRSEVPGRDV